MNMQEMWGGSLIMVSTSDSLYVAQVVQESKVYSL